MKFSISLLLVTIIVVMILALPANAASVKTPEITYKSAAALKNYTLDLYDIGKITIKYGDMLFAKPADIYNQDLAVASVTLANAAYTLPAVQKALAALGFEDIENYQYATAQTTDKVAFSLAHKRVLIGNEKTDIVAVIIRGTDAPDEWLSNFNMGGGSEDHGKYYLGFYLAYATVRETYDKYVAEHNLNASRKVWITGHSRGAAVTNIMAAELSRSTEKDESVYAYTFACPNISTDVKNVRFFNNIYNICSPEDFVTALPLGKWGFSRYGTTLRIPIEGLDDNFEAFRAKFAANYKTILGAPYSEGNLNTARSDYRNTLADIVNLMETAYPTRKSFADLYQTVRDDLRHAQGEGTILTVKSIGAMFGVLLTAPDVVEKVTETISVTDAKAAPSADLQRKKDYVNSYLEPKLDDLTTLVSTLHEPNIYVVWMKTVNPAKGDYKNDNPYNYVP